MTEQEHYSATKRNSMLTHAKDLENPMTSGRRQTQKPRVLPHNRNRKVTAGCGLGIVGLTKA